MQREGSAYDYYGLDERHAATAEAACQSCGNQDGQRCALLTTKSRNTCTRATVFSSSG